MVCGSKCEAISLEMITSTPPNVFVKRVCEERRTEKNISSIDLIQEDINGILVYEFKWYGVHPGR